jgi:hypothetical protein
LIYPVSESTSFRLKKQKGLPAVIPFGESWAIKTLPFAMAVFFFMKKLESELILGLPAVILLGNLGRYKPCLLQRLFSFV